MPAVARPGHALRGYAGLLGAGGDLRDLEQVPADGLLQRRLVGRGTETAAQRERRLQTAQAELDAAAEFDAVVVNVSVEQAVEDLVALMGL